MKYYDSISDGYEELYGDEQLNKARIILENIKPKKHQTLLDIGCGSGKFLELCNCKKIGIDPSVGLLKKAKSFVLQARAESLPFKDKSFDIVVSITSMHNFKEYKKAIKEIKRVAKNEVVISLLRRAKNFDEIAKTLEKEFSVDEVIIEKKDAVFVLKNTIK